MKPCPKPKKKRKEKTPYQISEDCAAELQKLVKMKAAKFAGNSHISCVTCGKVDHWKNMQGGHFIGRKAKATKLLEENIHPQCCRCNGFLGGAQDEYAVFIVDTYGVEKLRELRELKHKFHKWDRQELLDLLAELKEQTKQLAKELDDV